MLRRFIRAWRQAVYRIYVLRHVPLADMPHTDDKAEEGGGKHAKAYS